MLAEWHGSPEDPVISRHTLPPVSVCVDSGGSALCRSASNLWVDSELSAASQANAKTNLVIISGNPAHYRLLNYPINSTSWESLFATQANVCSQISWQEDSSIVQTQGFDNAEQAGLKTGWQRKRELQIGALRCTLSHTGPQTCSNQSSHRSPSCNTHQLLLVTECSRMQCNKLDTHTQGSCIVQCRQAVTWTNVNLCKNSYIVHRVITYGPLVHKMCRIDCTTRFKTFWFLLYAMNFSPHNIYVQ